MANSIALAEQYTKLLDSKYKVEALTAGLEVNDAFVRGFDNAGTVQVLSIVLQGLGDYSRATGFVDGDITATWVSYTIDNDRGRSFSIDAMDDAEAQSMIFVNLAKEFMEQHVIPEVDATRFAKLANDGTTPVLEDLTTGNAVLAAVDAAQLSLTQAEVPKSNRIIYMEAEAFSLLKGADKITRNVNAETSDGTVSRWIDMLDGTPIVEVPASRFATAITLNASGAGGYTLGGTTINFQIVHKPAVNAITRHSKVRVFPADVNQDADADKFQYRIYHDLLVYSNKTDGVYTSAKTV
jgi:hypothetical protein